MDLHPEEAALSGAEEEDRERSEQDLQIRRTVTQVSIRCSNISWIHDDVFHSEILGSSFKISINLTNKSQRDHRKDPSKTGSRRKLQITVDRQPRPNGILPKL